MKAPRQKGQTKQAQKSKKSTKRTTTQGSEHEPIGGFEGVIDPVVGGIYYAWWAGETTSWYRVVILPYSGDGDWKEVGITGNLFSSGLRKEIPNCFVVNLATDAGEEESLTWAEGYQDGGPKVWARKFPCLFLHDPLVIPSSDHEFVLDDKAEVLAFRPAQQLRHLSTILPPEQSKAGVDAHKGLARDFVARLGAIRAKQNPIPEQETQDSVRAQAPSTEDQQHPNTTTSVESKDSTCPSPGSDVHDLQHHSSENYQLVSGDEHSDISDRRGLTARNPRVSLPSYLGSSLSGRSHSMQGADLDQRADTSRYQSVTSTTSTTHGPSTNGREGVQSSAESSAYQAASRQSQPMALKSQGVCSPSSLQQPSSTSQPAVCTSQIPRALAGEPRGPTALRPIRPRKEDEKHSDGLPEQNRASGLRNTANTVGKDAVSNSTGQTCWAPSYSAMLQQPWRSPNEGGSRPENR